jgi:hypothetical protein
MTGSGLLGLAIGHGLVAGQQGGAANKGLVNDPDIEKGFRALSEHIGKQLGVSAPVVVKGKTAKGKGVQRIRWSNTAVNMYFLWSVERVGVLYNLPTIDGKDWYRWGVDLLLDKQEASGSWNTGGYPGATRTVDTCLALLFLRQANLASDLTDKVEFVIKGQLTLP